MVHEIQLVEYLHNKFKEIDKPAFRIFEFQGSVFAGYKLIDELIFDLSVCDELKLYTNCLDEMFDEFYAVVKDKGFIRFNLQILDVTVQKENVPPYSSKAIQVFIKH